MAVQPGDLVEVVTVEQQAGVADGYGGVSDAWTALHSRIRAKVEVLGAAEREVGGQTRQVTRYRVTIRQRSIPAGDLRLVWNSRADLVLNLRETPDPGGRALYRELYAEAGVPA